MDGTFLKLISLSIYGVMCVPGILIVTRCLAKNVCSNRQVTQTKIIAAFNAEGTKYIASRPV